MAGLFVTGTDTGVGKTHVSVGILKACRNLGISTSVMKPIASGAVMTEEGLRNDDAMQLIAAASKSQDYADVNPYVFAPAIAPHLAARESGQTIQLDVLQQAYQRIQENVDFSLVEGAGGWCVPLSDELMLADLVKALNLPVVLVVGIRLGCINHALLSASRILSDGLRIVGWVGNHVDPRMSHARENIETLQRVMPAPMLAELVYDESEPGAERVHQSDFSALLGRLSLV